MLRLLTIALLLTALSLPITAKSRKRVKPIVYTKPPSVVTLPDVIEPISYGEYWRRVELTVARGRWSSGPNNGRKTALGLPVTLKVYRLTL
jgi:hypothetical protein